MFRCRGRKARQAINAKTYASSRLPGVELFLRARFLFLVNAFHVCDANIFAIRARRARKLEDYAATTLGRKAPQRAYSGFR